MVFPALLLRVSVAALVPGLLYGRDALCHCSCDSAVPSFALFGSPAGCGHSSRSAIMPAQLGQLAPAHTALHCISSSLGGEAAPEAFALPVGAVWVCSSPPGSAAIGEHGAPGACAFAVV